MYILPVQMFSVFWQKDIKTIFFFFLIIEGTKNIVYSKMIF